MGRVAYLESGPLEAPPLLLVHGIPTSSYLWREVMRLLGPRYRCLAPDLMGLGDSEPSPGTPLHMTAQAEMLEAFMAAHGHRRFAVICHDQGGAAAQLLCARRPELVTCLVATNCVCFNNWPVPVIARLQALMSLPLLPGLLIRAGVFHLLETRTPLSSFRRGVYNRARFSDEAMGEYLRPLLQSPESRERFIRFMLAGSPRHTEAALPGLRRFERPTKVIWAADDKYISPSWGKRLQEEIPGAEPLELVPFCGHFWQEERPAEFVSHMIPFLAKHAVSARLKSVPAEPAVQGG